MRPLPLVALTTFSVAFGIEEAIIVVYLRHLPAGYAPQAYALEIFREACTLAVIGAIAFVAARSAAMRARAFCFAFGVWDIVYYVALWKLSGYPRFMDNDILFLIPVAWLAPVWAPVSFAAALILIGIYGVERRRGLLLALGFLLALLSFVYRAAFKSDVYPLWLFALSLGLVLSALPFTRSWVIERESVRR